MSTYYLVFIVYLESSTIPEPQNLIYLPVFTMIREKMSLLVTHSTLKSAKCKIFLKLLHTKFFPKSAVWQDFRALCYPLLCVYYILYYFKGIVLHTCISIYTFLRLHTITTYLLPKYISIYLYLWYLCDRIAGSS